MAHMKTHTPQDETERLREEFDNLRTDFRALAHELKVYAGQEPRALGERAGNRVVALREAGEHQLEMARGYAREAAITAEKTMREHPGYAIAGVAALGFLLGAMTARRR